MAARRPVRSLPRTQPDKPATTNRLFQTSTGGWYAQWKAWQDANTTRAPAPTEQPKDEVAEAVARWLTGA